MAKETKRRFITLELNPRMTDREEEEFKEWIAEGLKDLRYHGDNAFLKIPKFALRTFFAKESDVQIMKPKIIKP